jgi:hypothetical protein
MNGTGGRHPGPWRGLTPGERARPRLGRHAFRPEFEALEDRRTPAISFAPQHAFDVGASAFSAAVGDFNGDGLPDLATAGAVSVFLNRTPAGAQSPAFAPQQTFSVSFSPYAVAVGDFNGDGLPDLAVANLGANTVSVLVNTSTKGASSVTFAAPQPFAVGVGPVSVAVGDFNGDGLPDLATTNNTSGTLSVLLNTTPVGASTPTFADQQTFRVGDFPGGLAVADFNGDGRPDLAIASGPNKATSALSVLLNTTAPGAATASFAAQQTFAVGDEPISVVAADLNGDGRPDLATTNNQDGTVSVLLNTTTAGTSSASFVAQQTFAVGANPWGLAVADLDGDGRPELIVGSNDVSASGTVSVLGNTTAPGSDTPSFAPVQTFAVGPQPRTVVVGDFNSDGLPDLATANQAGFSASVLLNTTTPAASPPRADAQSLSLIQPQTALLTLTGSAPNGDSVRFAVTANPSHGTLSGIDSATGRVTYTANATYTGPDSFQFTITDTKTGLTSPVAFVRITVLPGPVAFASSATVGLNATQVLTLAGSAPNGDQMRFAVTAVPSHGTLSDFNAATGQVTYTPANGYTGPDSFQFTVTDTATNVTSTAATVSLTVAAPQTSDQGPPAAAPPAGAPNNQRFVSQVFLDLLGRHPDQNDLTVLAAFLDQGAVTRLQFVQAVEQSPEYLGRLVDQMYQTILGRAADPAGRQACVLFLQAGGSADDLRALLYGSPEYYQRAGGTDSAFLAALFPDVVGQPVDAGTDNVLLGLLGEGVSRAALAQVLLHTPAASQRQVSQFFQQFLGRAPGAAEVSAHADLVATGRADLDLALILASDEFFLR